MPEQLPIQYVAFWGGVRDLFVGLSLALIASNLCVIGAIVWAVKRLGR